MKVALVSPYDLSVPGGVQSHVARLADALRALGDDVRVVGPGRPDAARVPDGVQPLPVGRASRVSFNGSVAPIALGPGAFARTRHALERFRPDVIHVHEPVVPMVGVAAATSTVAPVVGTVHAWSHQRRVYRATRAVTRRVIDHLDDLVAVSAAAAEFHADALGLPIDRFEIVPNGVEVARFAPVADARTPATDGGRRLLFVGRLEPRKGLTVLLDAFVRLARRRDDLVLDVVGDGPERTAAQRRVPADLRARVRFHGRVDDAELLERLAACDLYVSPALGGESFGIVLLEAMAAGRAVVASDLPGYRSVVTDRVDGRLVPPGDPERLADVIAQLLDDPSARSPLVAAGHERAAAHDWPVVAGRIRERYLRAIDGAAGR